MKHTLTVLALFVALTLSANASMQRAHAPAAGIAAERIPVIDKRLQRYVDENAIAGIVALVLHDGRPVYEKAFGWADKEAGRRMTTDTIFRIASQTKALTSVAILQLIEEGRLTLSSRVGDFIPSFRKTTVALKRDDSVLTEPARRPITVRDLLTHTAGISYGTDATVAETYAAQGLGPQAGFGWYTADKDEGVCDTMARLGTLPFVAQPGERWVYGYNTDILGCIVEKASGMPLDRFIGTRITGPLGMKDTQFFLNPADRSRLAVVYGSDTSGSFARSPGMASEGAFGWGGAYGSRYLVDPAARLTMVLMIQLIPNATDIRDVFPNLVYHALQ